MPTQKNRQEIIDLLTKCGGLSYQNFVNFLYSIPFLGEISGGTIDGFISKFTGIWNTVDRDKGKYDIDYYAVYNNQVYRSTVNNNLTTPGGSLTWQIIGSANSFFAGSADTSTTPGVPTDPIMYIAETGTYPNFGGVTITAPVGFLVWDGTAWEAINILIDLSTYAKIADVVSNIDYFRLNKQKVIIDNNGNLYPTWTKMDNGGSSVHNGIDGTYDVTATGANTGIIVMGVPVTGIEYFAEFEVKLASGDAGKTWKIGWPAHGERVDFVPTGTWQKVTGKFTRSTSTEYPILIGMGVFAGVGTIQIKNFTLKEADAVAKDIIDRLDVFEGKKPLPKFDLASELLTKDNVFIPVGVHDISATIDIPSGKTITGVRGKSVLKAVGGLNQVLQINNRTDITLKDFTIKGEAPDVVLGGSIPMPVAGTIDDLSDALSFNGKGTGVGIGMEGERINIEGVEICNFDGYGIYNVLSGKQFEYGVKISNCYIHDCYLGIQTDSEAEYSNYSNLSITRNQIGVFVNSGNNLFTGCHIDKNRVGVIIGDGLNNAHGGIVGGTINHNAVYSVISNGVTAGELITGTNIWYGDIMILNSRGINFSGCAISALTVFADGTNAGGKSQMSGCSFHSSGVVPDYNGNTSNLSLKQNFFIDGSSTAGINNAL